MRLLTTGDAAKRLELSTERVRQLDRAGVLPVILTAGGRRLYTEDDVENLRRQREEARRAQ